MVSTARSVLYTEAALQSLYRNTTFTNGDEVVLVLNEPAAMPDKIYLHADRLTIVENSAPKGFAENMNIGINLALQKKTDLMCLNNDIIFTPSWLGPVVEEEDAIVLPACNQQYQYEDDGLRLTYFMTLADFGGRHEQLDRVAANHAEKQAQERWRRERLMPFYCVYLPFKILAELGTFDESFGVGGAEDVDYRVRALLAGFDVRYATRSYLLHFMGQSTWRSGEEWAETAARDKAYRECFTQKWGPSLAALLLPGGVATDFVQSLDVDDYIRRDDYLGLIRTCLDHEQSVRGIGGSSERGGSPGPMEQAGMKHSRELEEFDRNHPVTMEKDEIEYLVNTIRQSKAECLMVEWGSGASTLRWLREMQGAQRLISIEHNEKWHALVRSVIDAEPRLSKRLSYHLCPPNGYVDHGYGQPAEENPVGLDTYLMPVPDIFDADIFLVDGVARGTCLMMTLLKATKPDAIIFLHDWWPRQPWYSWATRHFASCERVGATLCKLSRSLPRGE